MALSPRSLFQRTALVVLGGLVLTAGLVSLSHAAHVEHRAPQTAGEPHVVTVSHAAQETVFLRESFRVDRGDRLDLNLGSDDIRIETVSGTTAEVIIEGRGRNAKEVFERRAYQVFTEDGVLHVRTKPRRSGSWRSEGNVQFTTTVRIPERFDARIDVGSGDVRVGRLDGDVTIDTGSGEVTVEELRGGAIRLDTGSGDIQAGRLDGTAIAISTGSGEVDVDFLSGPARIDTGSGDVSLTTDGREDLSVDTGSGEVTLRMPRDTGADIALSGGDVSLDRAFDFEGRSDDDSARGTIGSGGARIQVGTGSGDITLRAR